MFEVDPNLQFADEIEAYTSYRSKGHFTPNPAPQQQQQQQQPQQPPADTPASAPAKQTLNGSRGVELYTAEDLEQVHA